MERRITNSEANLVGVMNFIRQEDINYVSVVFIQIYPAKLMFIILAQNFKSRFFCYKICPLIISQVYNICS